MNSSVLVLLLRKLGGLLVTLFLSSVVIFSALLLTPGDPVAAIAGGARVTPEMAAAIREQYRLDDPVWTQYFTWLGQVLSGNLGQSFVYKTDVTALIAPRLPVTLGLVAYAAALIAILGLGSGILAATRGRRTDSVVLLATTLGMATPTFVVAIILIWIFALTLGWFPVYGSGSGFWDGLYHLTLPAISLAALFVAYVSRITRGALVGQIHAEHVDTARVRGIPRHRIFRRHVFLNASPQVLAISGTTLAGLFAASAIAEQAFGISGIGSLLTEAAARKDIPVVQIISLLLVAIFVVLNAIADVATAIIDPDSLRGRNTA